MTPLVLSYLTFGFLLLYVGGEAMVRGAVVTGVRLGMTPMAAGLTIVAFGTSTPELAVNLDAVSVGAPGLALGNVVGSNITNIGLILGVAVLMRPAPLDSRVVRREIWIMISASVIAVLMLWDGKISRLEGFLLVAGIIAHVVNALREARSARTKVQSEYGAVVPKRLSSAVASLALIVGGLGMLALGGHLFVKGAVALTESLGVPPATIGLTVVAIGTSLPELAASAVAAWRGYTDIAIGNVIGSNIFNLLSVLGVTASVSPVDQGGVSDVDLALMLIFSLLLMRFAHSGWRMERWEGALLLLAFTLYIFLQVT